MFLMQRGKERERETKRKEERENERDGERKTKGEREKISVVEVILFFLLFVFRCISSFC